ncbi:hypothetical protein N0V94_005372 [Neodidymelliopsis sp. IMI 364377]|nr:hypothetical protein N0V94_005372 [Neodidymelliopsis sp. IMI 364377]
MSDITPPSFIDDGISFTRRTPAPTSHANITQWLHSTASSAISAYTGSYIDDGADLLVPDLSGPGFGKVNPKFHKRRKCRDDSDAVWNETVARAVGGDIQRSLAHLRTLGRIDVRKDVRSEEEVKKRKGIVSVPAPLKWGNFVIKGDDGRVIVVDEEGEFDSGPVQAKKEDVDKLKGGKRWVKAASSMNTSSSLGHQSARRSSGEKKRSESKSRSKSHTSHLRTPTPKPLTPILESDDEYSNNDADNILPVASPTNFFMTGGLSGWPSRASSPILKSPVIPHAINWEMSSPTTSAKKSPEHSLLRGWPSPNSVEASKNWNSDSSRSSGRKKNESDLSNNSAKTHDTYKPCAVVEVIYDETPPGEVSYSQASWGGGKVETIRSWSTEHKDTQSQTSEWARSANEGSNKSFGYASAVSDLGWGGSAKASGWGGSRASSKASDINRWNDNDNDVDHQDNDWDGFERPKAISEVSVAGSGSERSWPEQHSQAASSYHSHQSHRNRRSQRGSRHSQTGWDGSQHDNKGSSDAPWGGTDDD